MVDCFFVTYDGLPQLDPHDRAVAQYLRQRGITVAPAVWNDPSVRWASARICVVRSTWDYHLHHGAFMQWLQAVESQLDVYNPPSVIRWNSHKFYLRDLEDRGVPVVPTQWLYRGEAASLARLRDERGWAELIVKPAFGASSSNVLRVRDSEEETLRGQQHLDRLLAEQDALVQPFLTTLAAYPERALAYAGGVFTHAVEKTPFQTALPSGEAGPAPLVAPAEDELRVARLALDVVREPLLFARVDLVRDDAGAVRVIELELVEPTLFSSEYAPAVAALGDAICARLR